MTHEPLAWYIAGPCIAACMALLLLSGKRLGVSSNFQSLCSLAGAGRVADFFKIDVKSRWWNLTVLAGIVLGGFVAVVLNPELGDLQPEWLIGRAAWGSVVSWAWLLIGGFLIGFGTRWADGCTSGHAISGLSSLQLPSLIAVIGFFIGGLTMTWVILPLLNLPGA